ncbi:glycosyltransferase family 2 protein [Patescibacteria group bacterium]|nr:glycosyltransferase family 2 protein [Patescibacteria group bacterium]
MPKVFVVILNWNNWPDTSECLESLKNNDYPNYQVVIVDNGSTEKFSIFNFQFSIKIIYNKENLGFAGGNNIGIKYALDNGADYVLLLNNDTIVSNNFLTKLIEAGASDKTFGLLSPKIYFYPDRNEIWFAGGKVNWLYNKGTMRGWGKIDKGQYDQPKIQETDYLTGCCVLIKREAIEKIGLMPEEYFLYYEDTAWSLAAKKAGWKRVFVPEAKIWHKVSKSSAPGSRPYIYYHIRNGLLLSKRYAPWYIKPFVQLDVFWRIVKQIIKLIFFPQKRTWARAILLGIKDFYLNRFNRYENWH